MTTVWQLLEIFGMFIFLNACVLGLALWMFEWGSGKPLKFGYDDEEEDEDMTHKTTEAALQQLERNVRAHRIMQVVKWRVRKARRRELAKPIPRNVCPGCFAAIYDGAAEQGWCCDCYPKRAFYEANQ